MKSKRKPFFFLLVAVFLQVQSLAQSRMLDQAKLYDYVFIKGKFGYLDDDSLLKHKKWNEFMFVDDIQYANDSSLSSVHLTDGRFTKFTIHFSQTSFNSYTKISQSAEIVICDTCRYEGHYITYIKNDSTAFYSTHWAKPFKYGEVFDYEKCLRFKEQAEFFGIKPGYKIASIGAASGWYEGVISVFTDSVDYLIQDIETNLLNQKELDGVVKHYSSVRKTPQTNTFRFVIGNESGANLPDQEKFDVILLNNCYHHFDKKWKMIDDLTKHLKDDGRLILTGESFSNLYYTNHNSGCNIRAFKADDVIRFYAAHGLFPVKFLYPKNVLENTIIFSKDKNASGQYLKRLGYTDKRIFEMNRLYTSVYAGDTLYLQKLKIDLLKDLSVLHSEYDSLDTYFTDLAFVWIEREKYEYALAILEIADALYPGNAEIMYYFGEAYLWMDEDEKANLYFNKAVRHDPTLEENVREIVKARNIAYGYCEEEPPINTK